MVRVVYRADHRPRKKRGANMHVGGHLREAFLWTVEEHGVEVQDLSPDAAVEGDHRGQGLTWGRLLGLLWHCTDAAPVDCCESLEFPQGSTFAQLARSLKAPAPG